MPFAQTFSGVDSRLRIDVANVGYDRVGRHEQRIRDLLRCSSGSDTFEHLLLTRREHLGIALCMRATANAMMPKCLQHTVDVAVRARVLVDAESFAQR